MSYQFDDTGENDMTKRLLCGLALAAVALTCFVGSASAAVVYVEDFNVGAGVKHAISVAGWTAVASDGTTRTNSVGVIDWGTDVEGTNRIWNSVTTWFVSDAPALASITQVRWLDRQSGVGYRLGLEVGGMWYLSDSLTTSTGGGFDPGDGAHPGITITDFSSYAAWGAGTSSTGAPADDTEAFDLSTLATAGVLPAGNITRIGLYGTGSQRFDYVEVSGTLVPEPSTLLLAAFGLLGLRRRRRA